MAKPGILAVEHYLNANDIQLLPYKLPNKVEDINLIRLKQHLDSQDQAIVNLARDLREVARVLKNIDPTKTWIVVNDEVTNI